MPTPAYEEVLLLARTLPPDEQRALIHALSGAESAESPHTPAFPPWIKRSAPVRDIKSLIAPFTPPDESADASSLLFVSSARQTDYRSSRSRDVSEKPVR